jgi:thiamine kinase-like enzyme
MDATDARRRAAALPCWSQPVAPEALPGGISNTNFLVRDAGRAFVVRIGGDAPEHAVYRFNERTVSEAAAACGLSPAVVHAEPDALVLDCIAAGRPLTAAELQDTGTLRRVVAVLRRCHGELPGHLSVPGPAFQVFHANRRYGRELARLGARVSGATVRRLLAANEALAGLSAPYRPAFCHNDLLAANLIDDGDRLWMIDWEYGGWHDPLFDIANLASNAALPEPLEGWLLREYLGALPEPAAQRRFGVLKAASLLRETLWSLVAERTSRVDFDYAGYTDEYLERFRRCLRDEVKLDLA